MKEIYIDDISQDSINMNYISSLYSENSFDISFVFKSDFKNSKILRDYLFMIFDFLWLDLIWKNRFILIVDELNNNAIEYGSKQNDINILHFTSKWEANQIFITIEVQDAGTGISAKTAVEMEELRIQRLQKWFENHNSIRWRGLFLIITKLVDRLYFKDSWEKGLIVGVEKNIQIIKKDA